MTKVCSKCGVSKDVSEFSKAASNKDGLNSWCKECWKIEHHKWYVANAEKIREQKRKEYYENPKVKEYMANGRANKLEANKTRYQKGKDYVESLKTPCVKCGDTRKYIIDFHHINPDEKLFNVSEGATGRSFKSISKEFSKCVCMCRNCHTEFHYIYGYLPEHPVESLKEYLGVNDFDERNRNETNSSISG
jgi:hypothetical protein